MDSQNLHLSIDFVGSSGVILSPEQKAALQTSLVTLKSNQKFARVYLWGKILGVKDDYYIAQGTFNDAFAEKRTLYSKDCLHWGLLTPPTEETLTKARQIMGRFTGDPSNECEQRDIVKVMQGDTEVDEEQVTTLKEEDRLAAVIADIDREAVIVPRGAYVRAANGRVYENRCFDGLSEAEAAKLGSYLHLRKPETLLQKTQLQRADNDRAIDFMDSLEDDVPRGSWSVQFERGSGLVVLRSLLWLGYYFYHVPGSRLYGSVYVGTGERNIDLPFML